MGGSEENREEHPVELSDLNEFKLQANAYLRKFVNSLKTQRKTQLIGAGVALVVVTSITFAIAAFATSAVHLVVTPVSEFAFSPDCTPTIVPTGKPISPSGVYTGAGDEKRAVTGVWTKTKSACVFNGTIRLRPWSKPAGLRLQTGESDISIPGVLVPGEKLDATFNVGETIEVTGIVDGCSTQEDMSYFNGLQVNLYDTEQTFHIRTTTKPARLVGDDPEFSNCSFEFKLAAVNKIKGDYFLVVGLQSFTYTLEELESLNYFVEFRLHQ